MKKRYKSKCQSQLPKSYLRPTTPAVKIIGVFQMLIIGLFLTCLWCKIVFKSEIATDLLVLLVAQLILGFIATKTVKND